MAFCGKCGAELSEGAKFCPKCGQPIGASEQQVNHPQRPVHNTNKEEDTPKTWQKIISVLLWPAGVILAIVALFKNQYSSAKSILIYTVIGFGIAFSLNLILETYFNPVYEDSEMVSEFQDVEDRGYENGYSQGFQMVDVGLDASEMIDIYVNSSYSTWYGAPKTPEEKNLFARYKNAYTKGFKDGLKARQ